MVCYDDDERTDQERMEVQDGNQGKRKLADRTTEAPEPKINKK